MDRREFFGSLVAAASLGTKVAEPGKNDVFAGYTPLRIGEERVMGGQRVDVGDARLVIPGTSTHEDARMTDAVIETSPVVVRRISETKYEILPYGEPNVFGSIETLTCGVKEIVAISHVPDGPRTATIFATANGVEFGIRIVLEHFVLTTVGEAEDGVYRRVKFAASTLSVYYGNDPAPMLDFRKK